MNILKRLWYKLRGRIVTANDHAITTNAVRMEPDKQASAIYFERRNLHNSSMRLAYRIKAMLESCGIKAVPKAMCFFSANSYLKDDGTQPINYMTPHVDIVLPNQDECIVIKPWGVKIKVDYWYRNRTSQTFAINLHEACYNEELDKVAYEVVCTVLWRIGWNLPYRAPILYPDKSLEVKHKWVVMYDWYRSNGTFAGRVWHNAYKRKVDAEAAIEQYWSKVPNANPTVEPHPLAHPFLFVGEVEQMMSRVYHQQRRREELRTSIPHLDEWMRKQEQ